MAVNFKNSRGFNDWLIQRVTALIIGAYAIFIMAYFLRFEPIYYAQWHDLFSAHWMKVATFIALLAILYHAWIGIWTVFTDYVKKAGLRLFLEILVIIAFVGYLGWLIDFLF